jgi:hypothetical protein
VPPQFWAVCITNTVGPDFRRAHDFHLQHAGRTNESAPETGALPTFNRVRASGCDLSRLDLQKLAGTRDRDRPRLHRLRNLAHEVDVQEPVLQARALDLNMIG